MAILGIILIVIGFTVLNNTIINVENYSTSKFIPLALISLIVGALGVLLFLWH